MTFVEELRVKQTSRDPLFSERVLIADGRHEEAISALSNRVRQYPQWAEPWAVLALSLSLSGRFDESLTAVEQALAMESSHAFAQELKTGLLLQLGLHEAAVDAANRLVDLRPERAESHAFLAFAYALRGDETLAMQAAQTSRSLAPNRAIGHQALCVTYLAFNKWSHAEQHALMALSLDSPSASLFHDLGVALDAQGKHEQAHPAFLAAAQLDSRFADLGRHVPTYHRGPSIVAALSATMMSGLALLTFARSMIAFLIVGFIGVLSFIVAIRVAVRRQPSWSEAAQPIFWGAIFVALLYIVERVGVVPEFI